MYVSVGSARRRTSVRFYGKTDGPHSMSLYTKLDYEYISRINMGLLQFGFYSAFPSGDRLYNDFTTDS